MASSINNIMVSTVTLKCEQEIHKHMTMSWLGYPSTFFRCWLEVAKRVGQIVGQKSKHIISGMGQNGLTQNIV